MSRVTSKLQVTVPKAIADRYGIRPGDEIQWVAAGETIRVVPPGRQVQGVGREMRLKLFDAATERQRLRQSGRPRVRGARERGKAQKCGSSFSTRRRSASACDSPGAPGSGGLGSGGGSERICTSVPALVATNVLGYRV